jgi:hypothetical protein
MNALQSLIASVRALKKQLGKCGGNYFYIEIIADRRCKSLRKDLGSSKARGFKVVPSLALALMVFVFY